ncbi:MAG: hypothetical protein L0G99_00815 [Propionibacteriales bacterium]|nr:hypothetical protein [Propionibacteriales bacterium]
MPKTKAAGKAVGFIVKYVGDFFKVPRKLSTKARKAIRAAPAPKGVLPSPRPKIDPSVAKKIKAMPPGSRPDPSTYLSKADIDRHLQPFKDSGAVRFTSKSEVAKRKPWGRPMVPSRSPRVSSTP